MTESDCGVQLALNSSTLLREYSIGPVIGSGGFAQVYLALHIQSFAKVAIKVYTVSALPQGVATAVEQEITALRRLDHCNIVRLHRALVTKAHICLVLEYADGGSLFRSIKAHGAKSEAEARGILADLAAAVNYCHSHSISHRDIKPENVVLTSSGVAKLTDFGLAEGRKTGKKRVGTPAYMPPEMRNGRVCDWQKVDVWGLGVVLAFTLTGKRPVLRGGTVEVKGIEHVSPLCKVLLFRLLSVLPSSRPSAAEVVANAWLQRELSL